MKNVIIFAFIVLILLSGGQSSAELMVRAEVAGDGVYGNGADTLNVNEFFNIEFYAGGGWDPSLALLGWATPFKLYDSGNVDEVTYGPGPVILSEAFNASFEYTSIYLDDMDGVLPDKFGVEGISMDGWYPTEEILVFTVNLKIVGDETTEGMFCIDKTSLDIYPLEWDFYPFYVGFEETCWPVKYHDTIPDIMEMWPVISGDAIYGTEEDSIDLNSIFYIDIYYYNYGFTRTLWQTPFYFTGTGDVSVLSYQDIWAGPQFYDMCDEPPMAYSYDWDGTLPDYLSIHAEGQFPGDSVSYLALRFDLAIAGDETTEGMFCIDRGDPPGENHDWIFEDPVPDFTQSCWPVRVAHPFICGDVNYDGDVNILDVTYLIGYVYQSWDPPHYTNAADVNNSCNINILDITYLIAYLYKNGSDPVCPPQWPCRSGSEQVKKDMPNMVPIKWQNW